MNAPLWKSEANTLRGRLLGRLPDNVDRDLIGTYSIHSPTDIGTGFAGLRDASENS